MSEPPASGSRTTGSRTTGRRTMLPLLIVPVAVSLVLLAIGWRPTLARGGRPAIEAMLAAHAVVLAAMYVTLLPAVNGMRSAGASERFKLAFKAAGQRFIVTLVAAAVVAGGKYVDHRPFLVWVAVAYVVLTLAETVVLARWMREAESSSCL